MWPVPITTQLRLTTSERAVATQHGVDLADILHATIAEARAAIAACWKKCNLAGTLDTTANSAPLELHGIILDIATYRAIAQIPKGDPSESRTKLYDDGIKALRDIADCKRVIDPADPAVATAAATGSFSITQGQPRIADTRTKVSGAI